MFLKNVDARFIKFIMSTARLISRKLKFLFIKKDNSAEK